MKNKAQGTMVLLVIGLAIILAAGFFLAISAIRNRPESTEELPPPGEVVIVEGQEVTLVRNPELTVRLVSPTELLAEQAQPEAVENEQPADQPVPTDTPVPEETGGQPDPTPEPAATAVPEKVILIDYTVQQSDSLYSVAQRTDTSIALMSVHNIAQDNLVPNTVISLPVGNPDYCPGRRPYAVGEGDTAFSIGRRFNISAEELREINNLNEEFTVRVADILCVP
ncbi:MAG: LysM peptidoglycan-binding domain-containing protein [Chloroflexi bacterium]|nr:MAG: LysM peptidoglycan-binding domain-containing protein [Chloroflexota bacterium]